MASTYKKSKVLGLVRELLVIVGALFFANFSGWESVVGLGVAFAAVVWSLVHHQGGQKIYTAGRKVLSLVPGVLVQFAILDQSEAQLYVGVIASGSALVWSFLSNGGKVEKLPVPIILVCLSMFLCSCGGVVSVDLEKPKDSVAIRGRITGATLTTEDGKPKIGIDGQTVGTLLSKFYRLIAGDDPKAVLLPVHPGK